MTTARTQTRTTTVRLPARIYDQAKCVVEHQKKGDARSLSLNDLIVSAITAYLKLYKRRQIDAAFAGIAEDADYQKEATLLAEEFEASDWEALRLEERDLDGDELYELAASAR
jgi:hypothetical protein